MLAPFLLAFPSIPVPEYDRHELYQLAASAERVVAGSITAVQTETFDLRVERDLLGGEAGSTLRLKRFFDWTCAMRWDEYQVGQRVVLFLHGDRTMGAGNEGDWPMVGEQVLAPYRIHGLEWTVHPLGRGEEDGTQLGIDELERALRGYRRCFETSTHWIDGREHLRLSYALDEAAAVEFALDSSLARHLQEETLSSGVFLAPDARPPLAPLALEPVVRLHEDNMFGMEMASPGDLNGDGWDDLAALGDFRRLWIALLDSTGHPLAVQRIEPDALGVPDLWFAAGLAPIGDFDRDGVPDLAVGAPAREKNRHGCAGLLLLNRDGSLKRALVLDGSGLHSGGSAEPGFGAALTTAGDLDGNGVVDLVVDIDRTTFAFDLSRLLAKEEPAPHTLPVLYLDSSGAVTRTAPLLAGDFVGPGSDVTFADALAEIGDLDGDGRSEIAIGYPFDGDGGEYRGAVWIAFLDSNGALRAKAKISDWSGSFDAPLRDGDELGRSLAAPGDLDGDHVPDLVVGGAKELWILLLQRDGTVKRFQTFGARAGGFVAADRIRSLALLKGPGGVRHLAVGGTPSGRRMESALWVLRMGLDGTLSVP